MRTINTMLLSVVLLLQLTSFGLSSHAPQLNGEEPSELTMASRFQVYGVDNAQCPEFPEPQVPRKLPAWTKTLASDESVVEVGSDTGAFVKGKEIVITQCTFAAVKAVLEHIYPRPRHGDAAPEFDIYFGCGTDKKFVINVEETIEFGTPDFRTGGNYRLIAPFHNVEFNGGRKFRIMKVNRFTKVTLHGFIFRDGRKYDMVSDLDNVPVDRWSGAAVLANFLSTVVIHRCKFINNWSRARFVRQAAGGAVMAESGAKLYVWGCLFKGNHATNGGAVHASSAQTVHIAHCTFDGNVAHGGYDPSKTKDVDGVVKPVLQIRGGALRIDTVTGYDSDEHHVVVCNTIFARNRLRMSDNEITQFGYDPTEAGYLFAGASAFALWNKEGALQIENGDHNLLTLKGCVFDGNREQLPWNHHRAGRYVFEARGAGHIDVADTVFKNNRAVFSVAAFDNSDYFKDRDYDLTLNNLEFNNNYVDLANGVDTVRFPYMKFSTTCDVSNVDGLMDGSGECISLYVEP